MNDKDKDDKECKSPPKKTKKESGDEETVTDQSGEHENEWVSKLEDLGVSVPPELVALSLEEAVKFAKHKEHLREIDELLSSCAFLPPLVMAPTMVTTPEDLAAMFGPGGAGTLAIAAAMAGIFGPGGAGAVAIAGAIAGDPTVAGIQATVAGIQGTVTGIQGMVTGIQGTVSGIQADLANQRAIRLNALAFPAGNRLLPLHKVRAGFMPFAQLAPITPAGVVVPAPPPAVPAIGAVPPLIGAPNGIFPVLPADLGLLSHVDLLVLARWYNDDFGIIPGDPVHIRRDKFRSWIIV